MSDMLCISIDATWGIESLKFDWQNAQEINFHNDWVSLVIVQHANGYWHCRRVHRWWDSPKTNIELCHEYVKSKPVLVYKTRRLAIMVAQGDMRVSSSNNRAYWKNGSEIPF